MIVYIAALALAVLAGLFIFYQQLTSQLGIIHTLVNSNLTKVQADLTIALQRIDDLEKALTREREPTSPSR